MNIILYISSQSIKVSGLTSPDTKYLKVGITEPDGKRRYISAKGNFSHTFKLTKTGTYTVYAENTNSIDIVVGGAYQAVD